MGNIKNVIIACDYAYFEGGAANVALQTVIALAKYADLNVYCFAGCGEPCDELQQCGAKITALKMPDLLSNPNKIDAFMKGIYNKRAGDAMSLLLSKVDSADTVVHIHTYIKVLSSAVFKAVEKAGFPLFLTVHEYFLACPNGACYDYVHKKICERKPLSLSCLQCNCDARNYPQKLWRCIRQKRQNSVIRHNKDIHYIFISPYEEKQLLRRVPPIKHKHMLKNPISVGERFKVDVGNNSEFVYIGRLSGEKGPQLFCEAVTMAGVKGTVIGNGILEKELKVKYPNILFCGWMGKAELIAKIKDIRALIFPTLWYEGSPLTIPEVQAYGIPCIVTNCSSAIDDIVQERNGEIVEPDAADMAEAMKRFMDNTYIKMLSDNTYRMFDETRCSDKRYVEELLEIYSVVE